MTFVPVGHSSKLSDNFVRNRHVSATRESVFDFISFVFAILQLSLWNHHQIRWSWIEFCQSLGIGAFKFCFCPNLPQETETRIRSVLGIQVYDLDGRGKKFQVPVHDLDASLCHNLSENKVVAHTDIICGANRGEPNRSSNGEKLIHRYIDEECVGYKMHISRIQFVSTRHRWQPPAQRPELKLMEIDLHQSHWFMLIKTPQLTANYNFTGIFLHNLSISRNYQFDTILIAFVCWYSFFQACSLTHPSRLQSTTKKQKTK